MSRTAMTVPADLEGSALLQDSGSEDGEPRSKPRAPFGGLVAGVLGVVSLLALVAGVASVLDFRPREALTVRSLLEGSELADVATNNLLAMGSGGGLLHREELRVQVSLALKNISDTILVEQPEVHRQLALLALSEAQKESALRVLRKYSDGRMVGLSYEVASAVREAVQQGGDHETLKRRLAEHLVPKLAEMQQLHREMFPGSGDGAFTLSTERVPGFQDWHGEVKADFGRRLTADVDVGAVHAQVKTLFHSLERELGDEMPKAPARMLQFSSSGSTSTGSSSGEQSFMTCLMSAVPNPTKVASCISDNMHDVIQMVMGFLKGGAR